MNLTLLPNDIDPNDRTSEAREKVALWLIAARQAKWQDAGIVVERWWRWRRGGYHLGLCAHCNAPIASLDLFGAHEPSRGDLPGVYLPAEAPAFAFFGRARRPEIPRPDEPRRLFLHLVNEGAYAMCPKCELGAPGHAAFHRDIDARSSQMTSPGAPVLEHRCCPFMKRGVPCKFGN